MTKIFVILNPTGGGGKAQSWTLPLRRRLHSWFADQAAARNLAADCSFSIPLADIRNGGPSTTPALKEVGFVTFEETTSTGDGLRLARAAVELRYDVLIVIGGDGSLSDAVNGIMEGALLNLGRSPEDASNEGSPVTNHLTHRPPVISPETCPWLPVVIHGAAGTGGDFSRLGYSCKSVEEVLKALNCWNGKSTPDRYLRIDVGFARFIETGVLRFFINEISIGLGYEICSTADKLKKKFSCCGGKAVFWLASFIELNRMSFRNISIRPLSLDGTPMPLEDSFVVGFDTDSTRTVKKDKGTNGQSTNGSGSSVGNDRDPLLASSKRESYTSQSNSDSLHRRKENLLDAHGTDDTLLSTSSGWYHTHVTSAAFCNGQYFGGGMKVSPTSNPTDGVLNLTIQREKFCGYLLGMASVYNGNHVKWKSTTRMAAPLFEVRATNPTETKKIGFEVDGELGGSLPVLIGVSGALMFAAP